MIARKEPKLVNLLASNLEGHILDLAKNELGNHIVQKIINYTEPQVIRQFASELEGHFLELSKLKSGKGIFQMMFEHAELK